MDAAGIPFKNACTPLDTVKKSNVFFTVASFGKPSINYRESDDVFRLESPFYLVYHDDRSRAKIL